MLNGKEDAFRLLDSRMAQKGLSIYRLSKNSGVPYATLNDICSGRTRLEKCSAETVYRVAQALDVSMEDLISPCLSKRSDFALFRSSVCHRLKDMDDLDFIMDVMQSGEIKTYHERGWYPESLYLLAMLDYVSRLNDVPLCSEYDELRRCRLEKPLYPSGVIAACNASGNDGAMKQAERDAIPEFRRFNIMECEVRDAV